MCRFPTRCAYTVSVPRTFSVVWQFGRAAQTGTANVNERRVCVTACCTWQKGLERRPPQGCVKRPCCSKSVMPLQICRHRRCQKVSVCMLNLGVCARDLPIHTLTAYIRGAAPTTEKARKGLGIESLNSLRKKKKKSYSPTQY